MRSHTKVNRNMHHIDVNAVEKRDDSWKFEKMFDKTLW